jgi:hypothetical protein
MVFGDLNYDILTPDKSQVLDDLCDIFDLANIVLFSMKQRSEFFSNFGWPDYLFYLQKRVIHYYPFQYFCPVFRIN